MFQGFNHFLVFLHHFVLLKLAKRSIRVYFIHIEELDPKIMLIFTISILDDMYNKVALWLSN